MALFSSLIVWILDIVNMALSFFQLQLKMAVHPAPVKKKKSINCITFDTFFRRTNFILMFFQEQLAFLLSIQKASSRNLDG